MIDKTVARAEAALADFADGATVMIGGFGTAGTPFHLIDALIAEGIVCSFPREVDSHHFDAP